MRDTDRMLVEEGAFNLNLLLRESLHVTAAERCECTSHPSRLSCGTASSAQCPEG